MREAPAYQESPRGVPAHPGPPARAGHPGIPHPGVGDPASLRLLWLSALASAALGAAILWEAKPGVNWGLWTALAALALAAGVRHARGFVPLEIVTPLALAVLLASGAAVTSDEFLGAWIVIAVVLLLASALRIAAGAPVEEMGVGAILFAPVSGGVRTVYESGRRAAQAATLARAGRSVPILRGVLIAVPVVGVFALLLAGADPTIAAWTKSIEQALEKLSFVPRLVFFAALGTLTLGAVGLALRAEPRPPHEASPILPLRFSTTERLIVLGAVSALFALFFALQLSYLFGNRGAIRGSGMTYAEWVHRGFGELTIAASLATLLIAALDHLAARGAANAERRVRIVATALVLLVQLLLDSAFRRVSLYEEAYGFTTARVYAQAYMVVVTACLLLLCREIWIGIDVRRLARRAALAGAAALAVLVYWNHHAWIAERNLARHAAGKELDVSALTRDLGLDAAPAVVAALPSLPVNDAWQVRACLYTRWSGRHARSADQQWYEWSLRRARGRAAIERALARFDGTSLPEYHGPSESSSPYCATRAALGEGG